MKKLYKAEMVARNQLHVFKFKHSLIYLCVGLSIYLSSHLSVYLHIYIYLYIYIKVYIYTYRYAVYSMKKICKAEMVARNQVHIYVYRCTRKEIYTCSYK